MTRDDQRVLWRRWLSVTTCCLVAALAGYGAAQLSAGADPRNTASPPQPRSVPLPVDLTQPMIVTGDGSLFAIGTIGQTGRCEVVRVNPMTFRSVTFPLTACAQDAYFADGALLLIAGRTGAAIPETESATDANRFFLERMNPTNGSMRLGPTVLTNGGSQAAHVGFAFGGGSLWIAGMDDVEGGEQLVQVSASSGAVLERWSLGSGGNFDTPIIGADATGAWVTSLPGGAGGSFFFVRPGNASPAEIAGPSRAIGTLAIATNGDHASALVEIERGYPGSLSSEILHLDDNRVVATQLQSIANSGGVDWTTWQIVTGQGGVCHTFSVESENLASGTSHVVANVANRYGTCIVGDETDATAALDQWLFVRAPSSNVPGIYRITLPETS